ncbi:MAG: glutamate--tRNA ligase [Proteobacteria bacterium]|nr:glutamate--tRNA ligase [Pseudomonadota bacterium]
MMAVITRFAPSPTGFLHVGNIRTALVSWLFARSHNGEFILRIDDTDTKRSEQKYVDAIKRDLDWLGLHWDKEFRQSSRTERYIAVKDDLVKSGRLYPCYEGVEELEIKKKIALNSGKPPIYDRASLKLTPQEKEKLIQQGHSPHWRFLLTAGDISWHDLVRGDISFASHNLSDPVWIREDGSMTYSIASVIDDMDYGITHIVRGEDHISNSALHVQLFEALKAKVPQFAHLALLRTKEGEMSKRVGGFEVQSLRDEGIEPMSILSLLAKIGTSDPVEARSNIKDLVKEFNISKLGKAAVLYDPQILLRLNAKIVHDMPYDTLLKHSDTGNLDERFWEAVKHNISTIKEASQWYEICHGTVLPVIEDAEYISIAATLLPEGDISTATWKEWTEVLKKHTGRTGKELYMPLRMALTGMQHGPEMAHLLPLIGREKVVARLGA